MSGEPKEGFHKRRSDDERNDLARSALIWQRTSALVQLAAALVALVAFLIVTKPPADNERNRVAVEQLSAIQLAPRQWYEEQRRKANGDYRYMVLKRCRGDLHGVRPPPADCFANWPPQSFSAVFTSEEMACATKHLKQALASIEEQRTTWSQIQQAEREAARKQGINALRAYDAQQYDWLLESVLAEIFDRQDCEVSREPLG